jgi:hypothetical protein
MGNLALTKAHCALGADPTPGKNSRRRWRRAAVESVPQTAVASSFWTPPSLAFGGEHADDRGFEVPRAAVKQRESAQLDP